jgi:hypothetical protein
MLQSNIGDEYKSNEFNIYFFNIMILKENSPLLTHHNKIECWNLEIERWWEGF